jgi:hypothetical protein
LCHVFLLSLHYFHPGTESGEVSDQPVTTTEEEEEDAFDITAPVKSFLERSRKQVQHYFSGSQDPVESSYADDHDDTKEEGEEVAGWIFTPNF